MTVSHDDGFFPAHDGLRLYFRRWRGESEPTAIIALVHGYLEHSGRYGFVGDYFAARGFAVYGFDHRGHGQSGGPRAHVDSFGDYLTDVSRYLDLIRDREGADKPIFLVGHSLGGLIALRFALEHGAGPGGPAGLRGVVVSSPYLGNKVPVSGATLFAGRLLSKVLPKTSLDAKLDSKLLTHDQEVIAVHDRDPLVLHRFTARWASEALEAQAWVLANAHRLALPSLVLQGADDQIADPTTSRTFYERVAHPDKTWKSYTGYYHEIFNELGRDAVFRDLETWLGAHL